MSHELLIDKITLFLTCIGLSVKYQTLDDTTFLPGIYVANGVIQIDKEKLLYPGDLLHEAGHLALLPPAERLQITGNIEPDENKQNSMEMGVICWSWAALVHLQLDPKIVFHDNGYRGASDYYIQMYSTGQYIGLPLLQWAGLCKHQTDSSDLPPFPHMVKWLREPDSTFELKPCNHRLLEK